MEVEILELDSFFSTADIELSSEFDTTREIDSIHGGVLYSWLTLELV
jgi:hypothetical protein